MKELPAETMTSIIKNHKLLILLIAAAGVIILDQITKLLIVNFLELNKSIPLLKNIFHITLVHNYGAAFGILQNFNLILILISVIVIGLIIYFYDKIPDKKSVIIYTAFIFGGTISNLIDRIRIGYVTDFIDFRIWPAFNFADTAITIGAIGLIIYLLRKK